MIDLVVEQPMEELSASEFEVFLRAREETIARGGGSVNGVHLHCLANGGVERARV